ncbi:von Hippel-Lindau tumor suppressor homolog [Copidosoma floridanum]|uniref:von Hippel-Lindau tumor suppressor homolog n=1 Tax=Copidosoma floridanum TaxID=29053 RepID=UPI0006C967B6|nr:von Hippel-Lindau tumor suppressor homolog [Copidosoma floridanum]
MTNRNEQQRQQELRSIHNRDSSFVKFFNTSPHDVEIYWIDYNGKPVFYQTLGHQDYIDINTFVTHPWIFVEKETKDRYLANGSSVYFPRSWRENYRGRPLNVSELPARVERVVVRISLPMHTLRDICLRAIKRRIKDDRSVYDLELPRTLQFELYYLRPRKTGLTRRQMQEMLDEARGTGSANGEEGRNN